MDKYLKEDCLLIPCITERELGATRCGFSFLSFLPKSFAQKCQVMGL
jgi:hypothetical protein